MRCGSEGCSREGHRPCQECSRTFCDAHITRCSECYVWVCQSCKFDHDQNNPAHEEGTPNA